MATMLWYLSLEAPTCVITLEPFKYIWNTRKRDIYEPKYYISDFNSNGLWIFKMQRKVRRVSDKRRPLEPYIANSDNNQLVDCSNGQY